MALDNAALLEVLEAMQAAGVEDRVRTAAQTIYQALIDAELTSVIGAGPGNAVRSAPRSATGAGRGRSPRPRVTWSVGSRSCVSGRSSPRCSNVGAGSIGRCWRWSWR